MNETYYAGAYWPCRRESAQECARRAETFFHLLSQCDPLYTRWFEQADSLKKALQLQFEPTYETFLRFFARKAYQNGPDGFSFSAWTGHKEEGKGGVVGLTCGSCSEFYSNVCLLHLPSAGRENEPVGLPHTGWLMYFSRRRGEIPPLPTPVRVEPVEDKGSLIVLTPERFTVGNPAHVALADQVRTLLDQAGLLKGYDAYAVPSSGV